MCCFQNISRAVATCLIILIAETALTEWTTVGSSYTLTCESAQTSLNQITWQIQTIHQNSTNPVFLCYRENMPICDASGTSESNRYNANLTYLPSTYKSIFTIKSVMAYDSSSKWYCEILYNDGFNISTYTVSVYAVAESPTCNNVVPINESSFQIKCITEKVLPEAECTFYVQTNNSQANELISKSIVYKSEISTIKGFYKTECTYTVSGNLVGPGSHEFFVVMYPNITTNITEDIKRRSQATSPIVIVYPKAALDYNCQVNNIIKENETMQCTCYNNNTSFLPTNVTWSIAGETISVDGNLEFIAKRLFDKQTFTCFISNNLHWRDQISYELHVAYGPDNITIIVYNPEYEMCDENAVNILGICLVGDSYPTSNVYINVNNSLHQLKSGIDKSGYRFNVTITYPGFHNVSCYANNTLMGELHTEMSQTVKIKGPSTALRMYSISNNEKHTTLNEIMTVNEGIITVICESEGGLLTYENITLTCGILESFVSHSKNDFLVIDVSTSTEKTKCTCKVWTNSSCMKDTITFTLNIVSDEIYSYNEIRAAAIGLGVIAAILVVLLSVVTVITVCQYRFRQKKIKASNQDKIKEGHEYSNLSDQHKNIRKQDPQYEMPVFKSTISGQAQQPAKINAARIIKDQDKTVLGGFISTNEVTMSNIRQEKGSTYTDTVEDGQYDVVVEDSTSPENP